MIYLLIFTCLCVLGTCVWIVKDNHKNLIIDSILELNKRISKLEVDKEIDYYLDKSSPTWTVSKSQKLARKKKLK